MRVCEYVCMFINMYRADKEREGGGGGRGEVIKIAEYNTAHRQDTHTTHNTLAFYFVHQVRYVGIGRRRSKAGNTTSNSG